MSKNDAIDDAITVSLDEKETAAGSPTTVNNFPAAIQEVGEAMFERYPDQTSDLSHENVLGMSRCKFLNNYIQETTGVRYDILDFIADEVLKRRLSAQGKGIKNFKEAILGIQASFEAHDIPLMDRVRGR